MKNENITQVRLNYSGRDVCLVWGTTLFATLGGGGGGGFNFFFTTPAIAMNFKIF